MVRAETKYSGKALTLEAFEVLLARLHPDREQAGIQYEALRLKLIYFFEARSQTLPDMLVDETINRLAYKLKAGAEIREVEAFALAIARFVWLEAQKENLPLSLEELLEHDPLDIAAPNDVEESSAHERFEIMRQCLLQLPPKKLALLREYYQVEGAASAELRRQLAHRLGISENALYLKIHRLRQRLAAELATRLHHNR